MYEQELVAIAKAMVAPGKGILAADESYGTANKRFEKLGIPTTEEMRRAYREMLFTTPGISDFFSGVILFDERFVKQLRVAFRLPKSWRMLVLFPASSLMQVLNR